MAHDGKDHWPELGRVWNLTGPPLRPGPEHLAAYRDALGDRLNGGRPSRVLILGVTPELYHLPWPAGTDLRAADRSRAMIDLVWPGAPEQAGAEEWTALSLGDSSRDVVLLDGGFHLLSHPSGQLDLIASVRRILAPGGILVLRLFVPPAVRESADAVLAEFRTGRIRNINALKLRLAMAMQEDVSRGVGLHDVWESFHRAAPDADRLAAKFGWPVDHLLGFEVYQDSPGRYAFATTRQVTELFEQDGGFHVESLRVSDAEPGDRCPVLTVRRKP